MKKTSCLGYRQQISENKLVTLSYIKQALQKQIICFNFETLNGAHIGVKSHFMCINWERVKSAKTKNRQIAETKTDK